MINWFILETEDCTKYQSGLNFFSPSSTAAEILILIVFIENFPPEISVISL